MQDVWKIPGSLKMVDVVCLLNNYIKALIGLQQQAHLEEDEIVLVNVGLGGAGLAAVDIATNVFRSKVSKIFNFFLFSIFFFYDTENYKKN